MRIIVLFTLLLGTGFAHAAEDQASFDAAYAAADADRKQAASLGHEWRDTRKMLKQAKAAAEKGDYDKAVKLATQAQQQGIRAAEQATLQAKTWQDAVPRMSATTSTAMTEPSLAADESSFDKAYAVADAARKQAATLGHEWRDTRKMLKQAKAAAEKENFAKAIKLAQQAEMQGNRAIEQAQLQAQTWQQAVPK